MGVLRSMQRSINIVMVAACPFPANRGSPARILRMSQALAKLGHTVHVVTYHFGKDIEAEGVIIHRIPKLTRYDNFSPGPTLTKLLLLDFLLFFKLRKIIKTKHINLIHAHHYEGALLGYAARALHGIPVIYDAHTTLADELQYYGLWNRKTVSTFLDSRVPQWADFNIAVSEELKQKFGRAGVASNKLEIIPTGANPKAFVHGTASRIRQKYHLGNRKLVIYTGSIENIQGIAYLLAAMAPVFEQLEDTILLVVGDGKINKYRRQCQALGIHDQVIFAGSRPFSEIPDYLAAADVVINPRINCPGMPQKLINYMMAGKAIVSFEGSAKLLSDGIDGLIVPNGEVEQMAQAVITLLKNPGLRRRLGQNAKRTVAKNYDWDVLSKNIEHIYKHLLSMNP
jgi:glycosyltransferase involved in cell wall biosynthesis